MSVEKTDAAVAVAIERVRLGERLTRRQRRELETWLAVRALDYLSEVRDALRAPDEVPTDISAEAP